MWHPSNLNILNWTDRKLREIVEDQNRYLRLNWEDWLGRYVFFSDIHEVFIGEFHVILVE